MFELMLATKKAQDAEEQPQIPVTLPPPYREPRKAKSNEAVMKLFHELKEVGKASGVLVHRCW